VFFNPEELEFAGAVLERDILVEELQEYGVDLAYNDLPPNVINTLDKYDTMDDLVVVLGKLTTKSSMKEIGEAFGYENNELIQTIKNDIIAALDAPQEIKDKVSALTGDESFTEYIMIIGGDKPDVALDAMRMQFVRMVNELTG
jgi:hypothetical protein